MRMPGDSVLVIGQAGVEQVLVTAEECLPGSKANVSTFDAVGSFGLTVASTLCTEGIATTLLTALGEDIDGQEVLRHLTATGVTVHATYIPGYATPSAVVVVNDGTRTVYSRSNTASQVWTASMIPWRKLQSETYERVAIGHLPADDDGTITRMLVEIFTEAGSGVSWNPGRTQVRLGSTAFMDTLGRVDLLTMNHEEAVEFLSEHPSTRALDLAMELASYCGNNTTVAVTDGGQGPTVCRAADGLVYVVPPVPVEAVDPTGAGDTFHAALVAAALHREEIPRALERARQLAATSCTHYGGIPRSEHGDVKPLRNLTANCRSIITLDLSERVQAA